MASICGGCFNPLFNGEGSATSPEQAPERVARVGFNPLFNGEGSATQIIHAAETGLEGFNPLFNGCERHPDPAHHR